MQWVRTKKLLPTIMRANVPWSVKTEAFFHLTNNFAYPLLFLLSLLLLPNLLVRTQHGLREVLLIDLPLFFGTTLSVCAFYITSQREIAPRSWWRVIKSLPLMMSLGIGLCINQTRAVLEALFGNESGEFVRTPKHGVRERVDALLVGTLAGLRPVKNIPRLVRAVAAHRDRLQLVVVGEGPDRDAILAEAAAQGLDDLHLAGFMDRPWRFVGLFDIFALSSDSEQFPISLVEAMAAGLPAASMDVGDVANMVAPENRPFVVPDEAGLAGALGALAADAGLRSRLGAANRQRAERDYAEQCMVDAYARLYGEAMASPMILR